MTEPTAAPVETVGPSNPTLPPKPTVRALVIIDENVLWGFMYPLFLEILYNTFGIPWPTGLRIIYFMNNMEIKIPTTGRIKAK
jgi:hypothetical protein